jgi:hypothetical protein
MITTIRNQFKQSTYRYIVLIVVFVLGLGMISLPSLIKNEKAGATWIAKVNGKKIAYQDFAQEVAERSEWLAHVRSQYGQYADLLLQAMNIPTDPKALAIEMLVKEDLISQYAKQLGIQLNPDYIAQSINDQKYAQHNLSNIIPPFVFDQAGALDADKLKAFLQHKGLSIGAFENKVEKALVRLQAMHFVGSSCYVPLFDIKQDIIATRLGKQFSYITFSFEQFLSEEKKNAVSDEDLSSFYTRENTQKRRYWVPEKRNGVMWKFDVKNYGIAISDEEIAQYYEDNKVSKYVVDPIKIQIKQITEKQLSQFPDFSLEMVREDLINNPSSEWAHKWELLASFARGEKKGAFEREAFVLQNAGDISPIVETKDGKVIMQLVRRIPRTYKPLIAVKNEIKNILIEKHFKKNFVKDIKAIASGDDSKAIELFISQKVGKKENVTGIAKNDTHLSQELFGLKKGEYAFFVENETGFAVKLTAIEERNLPTLDSIKDVVKEDLWQERAHNRMIVQVQEAKTAAAQLSFKEIQKQFGGSLSYTEMVWPADHKKIQELDKKELPARTMLALDKVGATFVHNGETTSVLIKLDAIEPYSENMLIDAQNEVKSNLEAMRIKLQLESFVASLHRNATIETNESILIAGEEYSE